MLGQPLLIPSAGGESVPLDAYIPEVTGQISPDIRRRAVIVCPGGGYERLSHREAEPVALTLAAAGFNAFVVWYRVAPNRFPLPQQDVAAAVGYVRAHAAELHTNPDAIALMGFSAGAHAAGFVGVRWQEAALWEAAALTPQDVRPNALALCYPVITGGERAHRGSFVQLTGTDDVRLHAGYSLETLVTPHCPPTFLWHTFPDEAVPVENSLLMAQALARSGVVTEMHIFPTGGHGSSLCNEQSSGVMRPQHVSAVNAVWMPMAQRFLQSVP